MMSAGFASASGACVCAPVPQPPVFNFDEPAALGLQTTMSYETIWYIGVVTEVGTQNRYGVLYMVAVIRAGDNCEPVLALQWAALADARRNVFFQQVKSAEGVQSSEVPFALGDGDWGFQQSGPSWMYSTLALNTPDFSVKLQVDASSHPLQGMGIHGVCPADEPCLVAQIEQPFIAVQGLVRTNESVGVPVTGTLYYQHMFGSPAASPGPARSVHWHWFCFALDDGWSGQLTIFGGIQSPQSFGNLVFGSAVNIPLVVGDFSLSQTDPWQSPRTGTVFNRTSHVLVPSFGLNLTFVTLIADNEVMVNDTYSFFYEGASVISGMNANRTITGTGYSETCLF